MKRWRVTDARTGERLGWVQADTLDQAVRAWGEHRIMGGAPLEALLFEETEDTDAIPTQ